MTKLKRKLIFLSLLMTIVFSLDSNAQNYVKADKKVERAIVLPTAKEALKVLFANGNISLAAVRSCKSQRTEENDKTIFDFLSAIIANQSEPKTKTALEYNVKLVNGKRNSRLWQVELTFKNTDEESGDSWNPGFRFLMRTQNNQMIRRSFECIGN